MTGLAVRRENLFAAVARRKFCLLLFAWRSSGFFHRLWLAPVRVKRLTAKVSRVTTEIGATEKPRHPVNGGQPNRERVGGGVRVAFFGVAGWCRLLVVGL